MGNNQVGNWTEARVEQLRKLWDDGLSCSQISKEIGGVTRNAVIGKVHRLGLPKRTLKVNRSGVSIGRTRRRRAPSPHGNSRKEQRTVNYGNRFTTKFITVPEPFIPAADTITPLNLDLEALTETTCRWPYGDGPFTFCGHHAPDKPYCASHSAMAYCKPTARGRNNPNIVFAGRRANKPTVITLSPIDEMVEAA